jgi:hypothetical protein
MVPEDTPTPNKPKVAAHEREQMLKNPTELGNDAEHFFDESKVPVEIIKVPNPDVEGLDPEDYKIIGEKGQPSSGTTSRQLRSPEIRQARHQVA